MERTERTEDSIKRYLMGELSAAEQMALEDEYFLDRAKYDQLCRAEDELLDRYARGALAPAEHERFERCYLTNPRRRQHVKFARALAQVVDEELAAGPSPQRTAGKERGERPARPLSLWSRVTGRLGDPSLAPAVVMVVATLYVLIVMAGMIGQTLLMRSELADWRRESDARRQREQTLAQQVSALEAQDRQLAEERDRLLAQLREAQRRLAADSRPAPASIFYPLSIDLFRGDQEPPELNLPPGAEEVRLQLNLSESHFTRYQVRLLTIDGREVFRQDGLRPGRVFFRQDGLKPQPGAAVRTRIPALKFTAGDNVLALDGVGGTGETESLGKIVVKVRRP